MQRVDLSVEQVLSAYDEVCALYPALPSLTLWRAWELAAYRRLPALPEPVLDVGCGDGQYFRLVWPGVRDVTGVDFDPAVVPLARASGVYRAVLDQPAQQLSVGPDTYASVFANCSLEHMDDLPAVLGNIRQALKAGGTFVLSVVTDKFLTWATLPLLVDRMGDEARAGSMVRQYKEYHHLANPLPAEAWVGALEQAGFAVEQHVPLVHELLGRLFLFIDHLWHVPRPDGELGRELHRRLGVVPEFDRGFRDVLAGVMRMDSSDRSAACGAVFVARRAR